MKLQQTFNYLHTGMKPHTGGRRRSTADTAGRADDTGSRSTQRARAADARRARGAGGPGRAGPAGGAGPWGPGPGVEQRPRRAGCLAGPRCTTWLKCDRLTD